VAHKHPNHSHGEMSVNGVTATDRYKQTAKVTMVSVVINIGLSILKIIVGYLGHSQSLVADGIHSLSDLLSDALILIAAKHSHRAADDDHPYGHGRFETIVTVALGMLLIVVAGGIAVDAIRRILEPDFLMHPGYAALFIAGISIGVKEFLYHYTLKVSKRFNSAMLRANAWHHRSDAISSIIVLVGIAGTMLGFQYLDAVAAIGVSLMIIKIGWDLSVQSVRELVDTALEPETVGSINDTIRRVDGVRALHSLRTRRMGGEALVDVHVLVNPKLSVSEGHYIGEKVREEVVKQIDDVTDVMVHIDPEDDEVISQYNDDLPQRLDVIKALKTRWQNTPEAEFIDNIVLHYLDGKIHVELTLPLEKMESQQHAATVSKQLTAASKEENNIADVKVLFH